MNIGQKLLCIKSWQHPLFSDCRLIKGTYYYVKNVDRNMVMRSLTPEDIIVNTTMGDEPDYHNDIVVYGYEISEYFRVINIILPINVKIL